MGRINSKREINNMMKKKFFLITFLLNLFSFPLVSSSENNIYEKIDLFGEVLEKINKEYVDAVSYTHLTLPTKA